MIDKESLKTFVESQLAGTDMFLVDLRVSPANEIVVEIDSDSRVDIDYCVELTRAIEEAFSRDEEDYELEVGSSGLTTPFKVRRQYDKNIGNPIDVVAADGKKYQGVLKEVDDEGFTMETIEKVKPEGAKRPVQQAVDHRFSFSDVKRVEYHLEF